MYAFTPAACAVRDASPASLGGWLLPSSGSLPPREVEWTLIVVSVWPLNSHCATSGLRLLLYAAPVISSALFAT